jgi:serine/threonine-protein kinase
VHGDIKCDNVIVEISRDGDLRPRLIDFGLARLLGEDSWRLDNCVIGTPEYLAPELILGGQPTVASDLYSVGVMLYELLTGVTPFVGRSHSETMNRHLSDFAQPVSGCRAEVSLALEQVVERALSKVPSNRLRDATAFHAALVSAGVVGPRRASIETFSTQAATQPSGQSLGRGPRDPSARRAPRSPRTPPRRGPAAGRASP